MRPGSDEKVGEFMGIRGAGGPLYVRSISKRMTASSSVLTAVDSFGVIRFFVENAHTTAPITLSNK
jgi:hypothetical protein